MNLFDFLLKDNEMWLINTLDRYGDTYPRIWSSSRLRTWETILIKSVEHWYLRSKLRSKILSVYYLTTIHIPSRLDPTRSIFPFFWRPTKDLSIVRFVTPLSTASSSAVLFGFSISIPKTAFSVLFKPTFKPTFKTENDFVNDSHLKQMLS